MKKHYLIPRLNYHYSIKDALISLSGIFYKNSSLKKLFYLFGNKNIYFTNHARTGIRIALNSLNLPLGSKIGVQVYNCFTVFNAINKAGFIPIFIDINNNFQIDTNDLKNKINDLDALIITHIFGIPADMDKVKSIAYKIPIIEDCAHSFLSAYKGKLTGTIGDIGVFSMGKGKFPSIGQGGFIIVNNNKYEPIVSNAIKKLRYPNLLSELNNIMYSLFLSFLHRPIIYGLFTQKYIKPLDSKIDFNAKFKHKESQLLRTNLSLFLFKLDNIKLSKDLYYKNLINNQYYIKKRVPVNFINNVEQSNYNCFMLPCIVNKKREDIIKTFKDNGIELGKHFSSSIKWAALFGYTKGKCPHAEFISKNILTIPTYYNINVHTK